MSEVLHMFCSTQIHTFSKINRTAWYVTSMEWEVVVVAYTTPVPAETLFAQKNIMHNPRHHSMWHYGEHQAA